MQRICQCWQRSLRTIDAPYLGVLGSQQKAKILRRDLKEIGIPDNKIDSFFCPMGLSIGKQHAAPKSRSALSSQLIQERDRLGVIQQKTKQF